MTATIRLARLPDAGEAEAPRVFSEGLEGLSRAHSLRLVGREDLTTSAQEYRALASDADTRRLRVVAVLDGGGRGVDEWLARVGGAGAPSPDEAVPAWDPGSAAPETPAAVVGGVEVSASLTSDPRRAEIDVMVAPGWGGSRLPDLLTALGETIAAAWGRPVLQVWTDCPGWAQTGSPRAVSGVATPVPGDGDVASPMRTGFTDLLRARAYRPVHAEWVTCLDVAGTEGPEGDGAPLGEAPGYEAVSWSGPRSPEHLLDQLARIYALAATDMPSGEMTVEPGAWDDGRVMRKEALAERCGREWVTTAVRPVGGELVGWTTLMVPPGLPEVVFQQGTLVRADHRGHGLAGWMKRVNLRELLARHPGVRRVYTWTEGENTPVIAMNTRIGFRPVAVSVCWERTAAGEAGG
jgi:GNAT superfamily N-acetyltransferase